MKKFLSVIIIVSAFSFVIFSGSVSAKDKIFAGRIIYVEKDTLEVKKKNTEMFFHLTSKTEVFSNKKKSALSELKLCQEVRVYYRVTKKVKLALKVVILKESDCI